MGLRKIEWPTMAEAEAFQAGIELVNDASIEVLAIEKSGGRCVVYVDDDGYCGDDSGAVTVMSPDGVAIAPEPFPDHASAESGLRAWAERFAAQGYYAAASGERIPLPELRARCRFVEI